MQTAAGDCTISAVHSAVIFKLCVVLLFQCSANITPSACFSAQMHVSSMPPPTRRTVVRILVGLGAGQG